MNLAKLEYVSLMLETDYSVFDNVFSSIYADYEHEEWTKRLFGFLDMHMTRREMKELVSAYQQAKKTLEKAVAGEPLLDFEAEEDYTVWTICLWDFAGEPCRLTNMRPMLRRYIEALEGRNRLMREGFTKFFPGVKRYVKVGETMEEATDEQLAAIQDNQMLSDIELAWGIDDFIERMKEAKRLLEAQAPPEQIIQLFP